MYVPYLGSFWSFLRKTSPETGIRTLSFSSLVILMLRGKRLVQGQSRCRSVTVRCSGCCEKKEWGTQQSFLQNPVTEPAAMVEEEARLAHKVPHPFQKLLCTFESFVHWVSLGLYLFLEIFREEWKERGRHWSTASCTPPHQDQAHSPGCAMTGKWTCNPSVHGKMPNQLSHTGQGYSALDFSSLSLRLTIAILNEMF